MNRIPAVQQVSQPRQVLVRSVQRAERQEWRPGMPFFFLSIYSVTNAPRRKTSATRIYEDEAAAREAKKLTP